MKRRQYKLAAAASLALCVAVCALWARSYFRWDRGFICGAVANDAQRVLDFWSERGRVTVTLTRTERFSPGTGPREGANLYSDSLENAWTPEAWFGFRLDREVTYRTFDYTTKVPPRDTRWTLVVPHWFLAALTAVMPLGWIWRWRAARRKAIERRCLKCGYDLRATPGRCPECGTIQAAQPAHQ